jgi:hypothetical protein
MDTTKSVQIARDVHDLGDLNAVLNVSGVLDSFLPLAARPVLSLFNTFSPLPLSKYNTFCVPPFVS